MTRTNLTPRKTTSVISFKRLKENHGKFQEGLPNVVNVDCVAKKRKRQNIF